jgi:hypothetical protein
MEESLSEDSIQEMLEELEEEQQSSQEPLSPDVEERLHMLQHGSLSLARRAAAEVLGKLDTSSPRIVQALVEAGEHDGDHQVRMAAAEALCAPVHQSVLEQHPELKVVAENAAAMREKQREKQRAIGAREKHNRKEPKVGGWISVFIVFGIVWVVISGIATTSSQWDFWCFPFVALPGIAVVALALWRWQAAEVHREVLLRSIKETVGTVEDLRKEEHEDKDGHLSYTYYVTVLFEADDAKMGMRVMELKAQVARRLWTGMNRGDAVHIRYAAEDPRIALIEGEW